MADYLHDYQAIPLQLAVLQRNREGVLMLLQNRSDRHEQEMYWSCLRYACSFGDLSICKLLVEHGALLHSATLARGWTGLHAACGQDHLAVVEYLVQCGADANMKSSDGLCPLHIAVIYGTQSNIIKALVDGGADIERASDQGQTAFYLACRNQRAPAIRMLLSLGCDPFSLPVASISPRWSTEVKELIEAGQREERDSCRRLRDLVVISRNLFMLPAFDLPPELALHMLYLAGSSVIPKPDRLQAITKILRSRAAIGFMADSARDKTAESCSFRVQTLHHLCLAVGGTNKPPSHGV
ncbi:hypothetical protein HDV03_000751 [Kappamyces sp. JEL0829]|nr:hypothetical protein HDV03_000751 [Kappamyces sp. JEL0829]